MRKTLLLLLIFVSTLSYSVPAKRITKTVVINGQEVTLTFTGNEKVHFWVAENGKKYQMNEDGSFAIYPESSYQRATESKKFEMKNPDEANPNSPAFAKARAKRKVKYQGQRKGLLILVEFADNTFTSTTSPREDYQKLMSEENYKGSKNYGSVRDYFKAQSYGQFDFVLDVVGPVKLSQNMSYYGANDSNGDDLRAGTMIWEACKAVDEEVDFSQYDWDGDGEVEQVFVLYAGYGEAQSYKDNTVWPHAWFLSEAKEYEETIGSCVFDGLIVDSYACGCELANSRGTTQDGIGTICHEFSHCFGLPDLYCTDDSNQGIAMDMWSILDYGNYADGGYTPVSYTAYERWACGWLEPTELSSPQFVSRMTNIDQDGEAYIIYNDNAPNEYYLLQNIQKEGWNSAAEGHGMLILHVDYDQTAWELNTVNNGHLRLAPICADNMRSEYNRAGDTYPGTRRNTSLTDESIPAATLFNANTDGKKLMHKPITDIEESDDGLISFSFMGGFNVDTPKDFHAAINGNEITTIWKDEQEEVSSYNIMYGSVLSDGNIQEIVVINEDFVKATASKDGTLDISSLLDMYLNTTGFTGNKLYVGAKGLKMSTSKASGDLITPAIPKTSDLISITLSSEAYGTDVSTLTVNVYRNGNDYPLYTSVPIKVGTTKTLDISNIPSEYKIVISASKRCYLTRLQIADRHTEPYANKTVIEGITSMPYTFTPAFEADQYMLQIQAVGPEGDTSKWSEMIFVDNDASAIGNVTTPPLHGARFNLNGQRVGNGYKGIMIKNGRKILAK